MTNAALLLPHFDHEIANTRRILERVPSENLAWKPHAKSMSLGRLASHVAELPHFLQVILDTDALELTAGNMKSFAGENREQMLAHLDSAAAAARASLAAAGDDHMEKTWTLTFKGKEVFGGPRRVLVPGTIGHLIHHRGQLTVYLRLNEVTFPGVYGPSADEMGAFAG